MIPAMSGRTAEVWWGTVADAYPGVIMVRDDRWPDEHLPAVGTQVEIRRVYRSPYWSLVEDTEHRGPSRFMPDYVEVGTGRPVYDDQDRRIG